MHSGAVGALRKLVARADVLTPNLPEAAALLGMPQARDEEEMHIQGRKLLEFGAGAVLIKGGHGGGPDSVDLLVETAGYTRFSAQRTETDEHSRYRLHARFGGCCGSRQGISARRGGWRGQDLCQRGHRGR